MEQENITNITKTDWGMLITSGVIGVVIGWYASTQVYGEDKLEFIAKNEDHLFCGKPQPGDEAGPKCYIIRRYKTKKLTEILNAVRLKQDQEKMTKWREKNK